MVILNMLNLKPLAFLIKEHVKFDRKIKSSCRKFKPASVRQGVTIQLHMQVYKLY